MHRCAAALGNIAAAKADGPLDDRFLDLGPGPDQVLRVGGRRLLGPVVGPGRRARRQGPGVRRRGIGLSRQETLPVQRRRQHVQGHHLAGVQHDDVAHDVL